VAAPARKPEPAPAAAIAKAAPAPEVPSRVLQRVEPDFPREAIRDGHESGVVKVRMDVDAEGNVTRVEILESRPRRVFDRAVSSALAQWKFNAGRPGRVIETEIAFRR
jgi:TonB family protein